MPDFADETSVMRRALELARQWTGFVEPNPCVGAVIVDEQLRLIGEGAHERYGGPHAEVMALRQAGTAADGATLFVTLEPCAHHGKTPPCADAVIQSGIRRVVIAVSDPAHHGAGSGIDQLKQAGINVEVGLCAEEGRELIAPFTMLMTQQRPFVLAKWAMSLDGKLATRTGSSKWISNEQSREIVHTIRRRMDAILVGIGTALADDPLLTARPSGPRTALRVVLDPNARLPVSSRLIRTIDEAPVLIVVSEQADRDRVSTLKNAGADVFVSPLRDDGLGIELLPVMQELGRRKLTNLLVEGGSRVLGTFLDEKLIDEVHCFIAPKLVGGSQALTPIGGLGAEVIPQQPTLVKPVVQQVGDDLYLHGRVSRMPKSR